MARNTKTPSRANGKLLPEKPRLVLPWGFRVAEAEGRYAVTLLCVIRCLAIVVTACGFVLVAIYGNQNSRVSAINLFKTSKLDNLNIIEPNETAERVKGAFR